MNIDTKTLVQRFVKYTKVNTTANPNSATYPSSPGQLELGDILVEDCKAIGLSDVKKDSYGYVTATLPSNIDKKVPTVAFFAHMDTSDAASGENVKALVMENYQGQDIELKNDIVLSPAEFPKLKNYIGNDLITTDGTTLLGADNKAGIAEIIAAMEYLINNPDIKHGDIKIGFTMDEEIGGGVKHFDVEAFGADFGYTMDGGGIGEFVTECFNAAQGKITVKGKSVHPGTAKNIMINASLIAGEIIESFPKDETPSNTEGHEGFYCLVSMSGSIEEATLIYIIRDHSAEIFNKRKAFVENLVEDFNKKYDNRITLEMRDEYSNFKDALDQNSQIQDLAVAAIKKAGIEPNVTLMRGGTDGSQLTFMGLPCPNIFSGGHNYHGPYEFIPIQSMAKAVEVIVNICQLVGEE